MDKQKLNKFLASLWISLKSIILEQLKGAAVKLALKTFLGSAAAVGFKAWLVKFIVTELWEEIGEPVAKAGLVEVGYIYHKLEGKVMVRKLRDAEEANDESAYNDAVDDIFDVKPKSVRERH